MPDARDSQVTLSSTHSSISSDFHALPDSAADDPAKLPRDDACSWNDVFCRVASVVERLCTLGLAAALILAQGSSFNYSRAAVYPSTENAARITGLILQIITVAGCILRLALNCRITKLDTAELTLSAMMLGLVCVYNTEVVDGSSRGWLTVVLCVCCCVKLVVCQLHTGEHPWALRARFVRTSFPLLLPFKRTLLALLLCNIVWALKAPMIAYTLKKVQDATAGCLSDSDCPSDSYCMMDDGKVQPFRCHGQTGLASVGVAHNIGLYVVLLFGVWLVCDALAQAAVNTLYAILERAVLESTKDQLYRFWIHNTEPVSSSDCQECYIQIDQVMGLWAYAICIFSVLQAFMTMLTSSIYMLQAGHPYLATVSVLVLSLLCCSSMLPMELMQAKRDLCRTTGKLNTCLEGFDESRCNEAREAFTEANTATAKSAAWMGLIQKANYQFWYSGPSLYTVGMFIVLLDAVTYSKDLSVAEFMSLFTLVQSVASQMGGVSTFLVSLDSALSNSDPMFAALTEAGKARQHAQSQRERVSVMGASW